MLFFGFYLLLILFVFINHHNLESFIRDRVKNDPIGFNSLIQESKKTIIKNESLGLINALKLFGEKQKIDLSIFFKISFLNDFCLEKRNSSICGSILESYLCHANYFPYEKKEALFSFEISKKKHSNNVMETVQFLKQTVGLFRKRFDVSSISSFDIYYINNKIEIKVSKKVIAKRLNVVLKMQNPGNIFFYHKNCDFGLIKEIETNLCNCSIIRMNNYGIELWKGFSGSMLINIASNIDGDSVDRIFTTIDKYGNYNSTIKFNAKGRLFFNHTICAIISNSEYNSLSCKESKDENYLSIVVDSNLRAIFKSKKEIRQSAVIRNLNKEDVFELKSGLDNKLLHKLIVGNIGDIKFIFKKKITSNMIDILTLAVFTIFIFFISKIRPLPSATKFKFKSN